MYWFKKWFFVAGLGIILPMVQSCKSDKRAGNGPVMFFDLKSYFFAESARLKKSDPLVTKTAVHNSTKESKTLHILNWENELDLFAESDINKPAWKASYTVSTQEGITTYTATDTALKTQYIIVKKQAGNVKLILIFNHTRTTLFGKVLYETTEHLSYVPDSVYKIQKRQFVRLIGFNTYYIKGLFD